MNLLRGQADVSAIVPMPVDRVDDASTNATSSAETVTWFYVSSGAWTSATGQAAGTLIWGKLTYDGVLNSNKAAVGSYNNTSLSLGGATILDTLVSIPEDVFAALQFMTPTEQKAKVLEYLTTNGYYAIDHRRGQLWGRAKDTVADETATYSYKTPVVSVSSGGTSMVDDAAFTVGTTPFTPVGGTYKSTRDSVNDNDGGAFAMNAKRGMYVSLETPNGDSAMDDTNDALKVVQSDATKLLVTEASGAAIKTAVEIMDDWDNAASDGASVSGDVAHDSADAGEPVKVGGKALTAEPTAVAANDRVNAMFDIYGHQITRGALREMKGSQMTTITSSVSETTVVTADATYKLDVYGVIVTNTSATPTEVTFKDSTGGTSRFMISVPANDMRGFMLPIGDGHIQTAANNNWTATCADSVASVVITVLFVKNL